GRRARQATCLITNIDEYFTDRFGAFRCPRPITEPNVWIWAAHKQPELATVIRSNSKGRFTFFQSRVVECGEIC
ncbi:MAG: hypothetical protein V3T56_05470, partial [Gemmatimonadales bacterium]